MKRILLTLLAASSLLATPSARAWTYNDGDLLLIFRNGGYNVEYDLGSVSQFLGHTNGYTTTVTGWDWSLVPSTFGNLNSVRVILLASVNSTNWVSGSEPNTTAYNAGSGSADGLYSIIKGVGTRPLYPIILPPASPDPIDANAYIFDLSALTKIDSYTYIASGGGNGYLPKLNGYSPFVVEQSIPGFLDFWQITSAAGTPPPPDTLIGTFTIDTNGNLVFVAGPRPSKIAGITHSGNVSKVSFTTTVGNKYSVSYTNQLGGALGTWPVDANTVVGDGSTDTISHTNSSGTAEFYSIQVQ